MMNLSRDNLHSISPKNVRLPREEMLNLPEKVLQFGTGRLLRGLPDYFIDEANRRGLFNGRIVLVKSTLKGEYAAFKDQDSLFTLCERGIQNGKSVERNTINSSVSRIFNANNDWQQVLECAKNEELIVILSNTTEAGIHFMEEDVLNNTPRSFPGKLVAFLYERYKVFNGDPKKGFVIIPTELIPDNATKLKRIVEDLARLNSLGEPFIEWVKTANYFCSSLVDRIVTGMPENRNQIECEIGYKDDLLTVSELYALWAIEGAEEIKEVLSFARVGKGIVIESNIDLYRNLKLFLLNGTHTFSCGIAVLMTIETVREAMEPDRLREFMEELMQNEISSAMPANIIENLKQSFIAEVLDRFGNPYLNHSWITITKNYTLKMQMRCIPLIVNYYKKEKRVPQLFALAFAAYLCFMKAIRKEENQYFGECNGRDYLIDDEQDKRFYDLWKTVSIEDLVSEILKDSSLWKADLSVLPGFGLMVVKNVNSILDYGMEFTLNKLCSTQFHNNYDT